MPDDRELTSTGAAGRLLSDQVPGLAAVDWSSRSSGMAHSRVTRGSTMVKMKSMMNCRTT